MHLQQQHGMWVLALEFWAHSPNYIPHRHNPKKSFLASKNIVSATKHENLKIGHTSVRAVCRIEKLVTNDSRIMNFLSFISWSCTMFDFV